MRPLSDGTVAVGRIGVEDVLVSSTALAGATLTVDLDRLDAVPSLVITNVSAASWWVAHVHGEAAVLQAADHRSAF